MEKYRDLSTIKGLLRTKQFSLMDLLKSYFHRIKENEHLNAFNEVFFNSATLQAEKVQAKIDAGTAGPLAGMIIGIKDNICYQGHIVSASSKMLEQFEAPYSATVVERLIAADAIIIGRLNCDEFAMGGSNENSYFGPVKNAANPKLVSGGSSGGSAVAVQADLCLAALGTDTGGSVRQPAAFCGCIGLKPTYGRISRYGVIAYASSFDQVGIISKSTADTALLLEVLAGQDQRDASMLQAPPEAFSQHLSNPDKKVIGVLKEAIQSPSLDPEIKAAILKQIEAWKAAGHEIQEVSFDLIDYLVPSYYILTMAEASSNLARYDGVHYGYRTPNPKDLNELYTLSRSEGFGKEVQKRILLGTFVLSSGYYDAYYQKAQKVRALITQKMGELFEKIDLMILPVAPTVAFPIGSQEKDPLAQYMADIYTVLASLCGYPAIALPLGNNLESLPLSIQVIAKPYNEQTLLDLSSTLPN
ncbi:MAG: Asp-tRNA(Asn)/Glu-tRNA(Gln) amidotransferase subunit GatA [Pedobacter sp.]|nr:MAG: Asp-tRNA(Asn)/Glu-tRNA(Gln) amidotransferase subunit GatA [Pedobacter sp.]